MTNQAERKIVDKKRERRKREKYKMAARITYCYCHQCHQ